MKRVLNVGQCIPDNAGITQMLNANFNVEVEVAESHADAVRMASESDYDLVLLNRIYDATGTKGLDTLKTLKAEGATQSIPVMLVSNFQDAQEAAVAGGAEEGFGKAALNDSVTIERLRRVLGEF